VKSEFSVRTHRTSQLIDITDKVQDIVTSTKIREGACLIYVPHTTACVCINENADPSVQGDIERTLSNLIPRSGDYLHAEGNSDAHIKSSIIGSSRIVPLESGKLLLGTWQGIYFCEFDGPRTRKIVVRILSA